MRTRGAWGKRRTAGSGGPTPRLRAGELEERRKTLLDLPEAGMVWEPCEEAWENKLAVLRSYRPPRNRRIR
ncbi:hypothetical protein ACWCXX_40250 [Streptomyces sp. NPDC001732]